MMTVTMNALSLIANDLITSLQSPSSSGLARGLSRRDDGHSSYPATSNIRSSIDTKEAQIAIVVEELTIRIPSNC